MRCNGCVFKVAYLFVQQFEELHSAYGVEEGDGCIFRSKAA